MSILFFSCHSNHSTPISFNYPDPNSKLYTICRQDLVSFDRNSAKEKLRRTEVVWCWTEELSPLWNNAQVPSQPCSSLISKRPCNLVHGGFVNSNTEPRKMKNNLKLAAPLLLFAVGFRFYLAWHEQ